MNNSKSIPTRVLFVCALVIALGACDSSSDESTVLSVNGKVTDNSGFGKSQAPIEGAVVSAATIGADGTFNELEGTTATGADGSYSLELNSSANLIVASAETATYTGSVLIATDNNNTSVSASPMNTETTAEVTVYQEIKESGESASFVDVVVYVDRTVAADVFAAAGVGAEVASVIAAGDNGEEEYMDREDIDRRSEKEDDLEDRERAAFVSLQSDLAAAASSSEEATAVEAFEEALIDASISAGFSAESQARAQHASQSAAKRFNASTNLSAGAEFSLNKRLAVMTALAVSKAVNAYFESAGASAGRIATIAAAGESWINGTRSATVENELMTEYADYSSTIEVELAAEMGVLPATIDAAKLATETAKSAFESSVSTAVDAAEVADAHVAFYIAAEAAISSVFGTSTNAEMGTEVLALLAVGS